ncbi:Holliday junction branch migration protein RuvA [Lacicoccus alkaliphilus]|uniref:Holliday junction branch migration complex subunit RuvA n=1 Tax=Lacicoccus alkaliphilus DSM 16010 TaxID=1123231 RepID=A0A1M7BSU7_9BACL|nr:Holliday junction branch migration protein RuvA [Salinicoccus alkaliphilus]SHL58050.1 Holliday junction DNA helicase subunit RuvA [Salinicoccus alkaliphilus DSM 16010]
MYQYIEGTVAYVSPHNITVDVSGVGYLIHVPNPFRFESEQGTKLCIFTELIVRDDSHTLYGFKEREEKQLFQHLLKVKGIGPKSALAILASSAPDEVITAIEREDQAFMSKFPGIGKKTASQIILDLKGKLEAGDGTAAPARNNHVKEAVLALEALGYSRKELAKVEKKLQEENFGSVDAAVKAGLKLLVQ